MIPIAAIMSWRQQAPWKELYQVEQDLVLTRALVEIFSHATLQGAFAFRGGTALQKLFYKVPSRYSEDIDLVQVEKKSIGSEIDAIRSLIDPWLGKPQRNASPDRVSLIYRFDSEGPDSRKMRLKIEVNTGEHFTVLGHQKKRIAVNNPWFSGTTETLTYEVEELLGTKLRALYQRKKGRDLFDMGTAMDSIPNLRISKIIECFSEYMKHDGFKVTRAQYEANLTEKLADSAFTRDIEPLLMTNSSHFDPHQAGEELKSSLISLLPGDPWKGKRKG